MRKLLIALCLILGVVTAQATTYTWTNNANGTWQNAGNWSPNGIPTTGDTAIFSNATGRTITLTNESCQILNCVIGAWTFATGTGTIDVLNYSSSGSSTFGGTLAGTGVVNINNGQLTLAGSNSFNGGINLNSGTLAAAANVAALGVGTVTWNGGKVAPGSSGYLYTNSLILPAGGHVLIDGSANAGGFSGPVLLTGNTTVFGGINNTLSLTGPISDGGSNYSITIAGTGNGSVLLSNTNNSFGGGVNLINGTLKLSANKAPGTGTLTWTNASSLTGPDTATITITNTMIVGAGFTNALSTGWGGGGHYDFAGPMTLVTNAYFLIGGSIATRFSGPISGAFGITFGSSGVGSILAGTNTFTGGVFNNSGALTLAASNSILGDVVINAGTLNLNATNSMGGTLYWNSRILQSGVGYTLTLTNAVVMGSAANYTNTYQRVGVADSLVLSGPMTLTNNTHIRVANGSTLSLTGPISGSYPLVLDTFAYNITLAGSNTISGGVTVLPQTSVPIPSFVIGRTDALGSDGLTWGGGVILGNKVTPAAALTITNPITIGSGSHIVQRVNAGNEYTYFTAPITLTNNATLGVDNSSVLVVSGNIVGNYTLTVTNNAANTLLFSNVISTASITKQGIGITTFANPNCVLGDLLVQTGTVSFTSAQTLSLNTTLKLNATNAVANLNYVGTNTIAGIWTKDVPLPIGLYSASNLSPYLTGTGFLQIRGYKLRITASNKIRVSPTGNVRITY